ncbi:unnamed protein product [Calypogeia fissa]
MATTAASPGVSSATTLSLPSLEKRISLITGFKSFASVRSCRAASTSSFAFCSTSCRVEFHSAMVGKAGEPKGREALNLWYPNKRKQSLGLTASSARRQLTKMAASRQEYNNAGQPPESVPVWLWICLALYRTLTDFLQFLWEQPGQLKDIEWPSFQSTIRMAVLTVIVVAFLIIFLATIDSTFSYVLSSILRSIP